MTVTAPFHVDLRPFLPATWQEEVDKFAASSMFTVRQAGGGPGSIGVDAAIDYETALRPELVAAMPWLTEVHEQVIPVLMNLSGLGGLAGDPRADGELTPITASHGIVVNVFTPGRQGIEWHRDGADVFLNVILSTDSWDRDTGGRLMVHDGQWVQFKNLAEPGVGVVVLTGDLPHSVEPLKDGSGPRTSLLFSYTNPERSGWREARYNEHFYDGRD